MHKIHAQNLVNLPIDKNSGAPDRAPAAIIPLSFSLVNRQIAQKNSAQNLDNFVQNDY